MNDPNGFSYYQGKYHLFYQYYPYKTVWGPHALGPRRQQRPCCTGTICPRPWPPTAPSDKDGCFSGSAAQLPDGRQLLLYTSRPQGKSSRTARPGMCRPRASPSEMASTTSSWLRIPCWTKPACPKASAALISRDPKIWQEADGSYSAVLVGQGKTEGGAALLFHSADGFHWEYVTILGRQPRRIRCHVGVPRLL